MAAATASKTKTKVFPLADRVVIKPLVRRVRRFRWSSKSATG